MYYKLKDLTLKQRLSLKRKVRANKSLHTLVDMIIFIDKYLKRKLLVKDRNSVKTTTS